MLEIQYANTYSDSYGSKYEKVRKVTSRAAFFRDITNINNPSFFLANSIVKRRWFRRCLHVLLLDCDGTAEMLAAANTLATEKIGYSLIQSSPSRYWIVADKVGTFIDLCIYANGIPGVDPKFIQSSAKYNRFFLRLTPIHGKMPIFQGKESLTDPLVCAWYDEFERLWRSEPVNRRSRAEVLLKQMRDGSIYDTAADPEFEL